MIGDGEVQSGEPGPGILRTGVGRFGGIGARGSRFGSGKYGSPPGPGIGNGGTKIGPRGKRGNGARRGNGIRRRRSGGGGVRLGRVRLGSFGFGRGSAHASSPGATPDVRPGS